MEIKTFDFPNEYGNYIDWLIQNDLLYHFDDQAADCFNLDEIDKDLCLILIVNDFLMIRCSSEKESIWTWIDNHSEYQKKLGIG